MTTIEKITETPQTASPQQGWQTYIAELYPSRWLCHFPGYFWATALIVTFILGIAIISPDLVLQNIQRVNQFIFNYFGGFYLSFVALLLVVFLLIGISPLGTIRLGGHQTRPQYSTFSWLSMLFSAGMGTGLMFWGAAEPLYHSMNPPLANGGGVPSPLLQGFYLSFFHWGLHPWAIYGMTTLAIAFFGYNLNRGFSFSSFLSKSKTNHSADSIESPPAEASHRQITRWIIDISTIVAVVSGVSATLGMGVIHLEGGFFHLLHWNDHLLNMLVLLTISFITYMTSSLLGLDKGIRVISNTCVLLSFLLLLVVALSSPPSDTAMQVLQGIPGYFALLPSLSLGIGNFLDPHWVGQWTVMYWSWWIAWAPFVGIFIATISKGRTVRELVFGVLLAPTLFSWIWFTVFGQAAVTAQTQGQLAGDQLDLSQVNLILFQLLDFLKANPVWIGLSICLIGLNFINSADSATYTLACLSRRDVETKPHAVLQLGWGLLLAILAALFLALGGIEILQQITLITTLPFAILLGVIFCLMVYKMFGYYTRQEQHKPLPTREG